MSVTISDDIISLEKLSKLYDIISHLYGSNLNHVIINNKTVFCSIDLFTFLSPKCDVIKMMLSYLKNQTILYKDGGLFAAMVTINLVRKYKMLDVSLRIVSDTNQLAFAEIEKACDELSLKSDIGKLKDVSALIKTIISSKLALYKTSEMLHLCLLFARVFTIHNPLQNCHVILNENSPIEESQLHDGLLLRLDKYFDGCSIKKKGSGPLRVIIFSVALALDSEEILSEGGISVVNVESVSQFKGVVLQMLMDIGMSLASSVDVVICQKVVHPELKRLFKNNSIVCVDRVGGNVMPVLEIVCGCQCVSSLVCRDMSSFIGHISVVDVVQINGDKFYLKLYSQAISDLKTLVLCNKNENEVNALHRCYETSMIALKVLSNNGYVVCGGGCMETQISLRLQKLRQYDVSAENFKHLNVVMFSLLSTSMAITEGVPALHHSVDNIFHHHWVNVESSSRCCCGALNKNPNFRFISFLELFHCSPQCYPFPVENNKLDKFEKGVPAIVHVKDIFVGNLRSAFELSELLLRIGTKIIPN